jgi:DNA-binding MarR family transcriptional regulator
MTKEREQLLADLMAQLRTRQNVEDEFDDAAAARLGINRTDMRCLDILEREGPMTAGRLAGEAGLTSGGITAVLDHLERAGYVKRVRDTQDRRRVMVEIDLDGMGKGGAGEIWGPLGEEAMELFGRFSDAEIETITDFVRSGIELNRKHLERIKALPARAR